MVVCFDVQIMGITFLILILGIQRLGPNIESLQLGEAILWALRFILEEAFDALLSARPFVYSLILLRI